MKHISNFFRYEVIRNLLLVVAFGLGIANAQAQNKDLKLSLGASYGIAPNVTYGNSDDAGSLVSVFGDLQYQNIIGQIQFASALAGTFEEGNFESGSSLHGSIGYVVDIVENFKLPIMVSGGAAFIKYNNSFGGGSGNAFSDVSPQVGVTLAPYYQFTPNISVQGSARYFKGFKGSVDSEPIDLTHISIGLRITI
ncbi:MAG: outer membrane beta-barrel protein [Saprospiraceae bacterium]|nr:outer membrane beta-barrel protein [Saprospiraceae bacterium]